jgi:hypothetical protein
MFGTDGRVPFAGGRTVRVGSWGGHDLALCSVENLQHLSFATRLGSWRA